MLILEYYLGFLLCFQMQPQLFPKSLTVQWLISASGSYSRASRNLAADVQNSDLDDIEMCRVLNDRLMTVRRIFLEECEDGMSDAYSLLTNCVRFPPAPQHSAPHFFIKNNIVGIKKNSNELIFAGHCCVLYRFRILTDIYSPRSTESSPLTPTCIFNCSFLDQILHRYFLSFLAST